MKMIKRIRLGVLLVAVLVIGMAFVATSSAPAVDSNINDSNINNSSINNSSINDSSNTQEIKLPDDQRATVATNISYESEIGDTSVPQFREDAIVYFKEMPDIGAFASKYRGKVIFVKPDIKMAAFETNSIGKTGEVNQKTLDLINEISKDPLVEKAYHDGFMFVRPGKVISPESKITYPEDFDIKGLAYAPKEVKVGFWRLPSSLEEFASKYGAKLVYVEDVLLFAVFETDNTTEFIKKVSTDPYVRHAEPNGIFHSGSTPNDPKWDLQWGPKNIHAPEAWDYQNGSTTVVVAVLDTGVDYNHEDLAGRVYQGYNFVNNNSDPMDDSIDSHGTHVAGIAGAIMNNSKGIAGIAQSNIFAVKVMDSNGQGTAGNIARGIRYAANNSAKIISMSIWAYINDSDIEAACNYAYYTKGSLLVAISGNDGIQQIAYPAALDTVIAVGATDSNDQRWSNSNYGSELELVAPGVEINSTIRNNQYANETGTSMAAPHVSGVAALIWSQNPALSNNEVRQILTNTADDLGSPGRDIYYGYGRVNAYRAGSLPGWSYRKQKTITGTTAGAQTNYQMKLTLYNSTGTDTPGNIYLGGNVRSDFGDIRFTKSDGVTLLDYWIESYTPGVSAVVWVKVDSIPASPGTANIYLYYGSPSATSASNGNNAFVFFDDFNDGAYTGWFLRAGNSILGVSNGWFTVQGTSSYGNVEVTADNSNVSNHAYELKLQTDFANNPNRQGRFMFRSTRPYYNYVVAFYPTNIRLLRQTGSYSETQMAGTTFYWDDTKVYNMKITGYGNQLNVYINDVLTLSASDSTYSSGNIEVGNREVYGGTWKFDDTRVRKYSSPEPTWG
ncbi:Halolysin [uncultured archaeon]|nr:Halolysin [uncultured archaeon]